MSKVKYVCMTDRVQADDRIHRVDSVYEFEKGVIDSDNPHWKEYDKYVAEKEAEAKAKAEAEGKQADLQAAKIKTLAEENEDLKKQLEALKTNGKKTATDGAK